MPDVVPGKDLRLPDPVDGVLGVVTGRGRVVPPASPVSVPDSKKQCCPPLPWVPRGGRESRATRRSGCFW